jgi:YVTN family beta-propeller protein
MQCLEEVIYAVLISNFKQNNCTMINKISISGILIAVSLTSMFISCEENNSKPDNLAKGPYMNGIFITNEGSFGNSNGSISFYSYNDDASLGVKSDTIYNSIFSEVNHRDLGDVVQSISIFDSLAYIVVNNSNKVEVVTYTDFKEKDVITGISQPRYIVVNGNTGYVSAWGDNGVVYVVTLTSFDVSSTIKVGNGPEKMLIEGDKLYVANSGGLYSDSTISVIDLNTNKLIDTIQVGGNPKAFVKDRNGSIWVLCYGIIEYSPVDYSISRETPSLLLKLNQNDEVVTSITISEKEHPSTLDINPSEDTLYFGGGYGYAGIKSIPVTAASNISEQVVADLAYSFMIDPNTGVIFSFVSTSFTDNGLLNRYRSNGSFIKSYTVGIGPNGGTSAKNAIRR